MHRSLGALAVACWLAGAGAMAAASRDPAPAPPVFASPTSPAALQKITAPAVRSLAGAKVLRGTFVQRRFLAGLARPLESTGVFLYAKEAGIEWHTMKPFDSRFILTRDRITQIDEGGVSLEIKAADQPALAVVARVFFALFALDVDALSHDFDLYGRSVGADRWELGLKPRTEALGSMFRQALVTGSGAVHRVTLEDGNGDHSEIEFSAVVFDPKGLTPDERRRF
jgi:hypothetical protein